MYTPSFNAVTEERDLRELVAAARAGWLVTVGPDGLPVATFLPVVWREGTVLGHLSRANEQWRELQEGAACLVICTGPDAYVSPSWYATKQDGGRVVPTWNYSAVQLAGTVHVHDDVAWVRDVVTELTNLHERDRAHPWRVADAPEAYVEGQLRGIVGVEVRVSRVQGKAKLSQNRPAADRRGVIEGLRHEPFAGAPLVAEAMEKREEH